MLPIVFDPLKVVSQSGVDSWPTMGSTVPVGERDQAYLVVVPVSRGLKSEGPLATRD